jgi:hypothetical protein
MCEWIILELKVGLSAFKLTSLSGCSPKPPTFESGSGLTTKQRTLAIVVMSLLLYIGVGAVVFALLESHQVTFSDALYFSVCTVYVAHTLPSSQFEVFLPPSPPPNTEQPWALAT